MVRNHLNGVRGKLLALASFLSSLAAALDMCRAEAAEHPALVVVVSVDQLPYEYLERFREGFAADGIFQQFRERGAWFTNACHRHAFTYTAPGHAVLLTGAYPCDHGIIDNRWFDRTRGKQVYCVLDEQATLIGTSIDDERVSPRALLCETVGDRLKLEQPAARVFAIAIKDRAAILMAGRAADAAFWMSNDGKWITSDYYRSDIPGYLRALSGPDSAAAPAVYGYGQADWNLLLSPDRYRHGVVEDSRDERPIYGMGTDFPHAMPAIDDKNYIKQMVASPFGNEAVLAAAREIVIHEQLGQDTVPDILCVNLSSNDYVGHSFGPQSLEVEDMTCRTDRQLADFARFVDAQLPGRNWVLILTSDHGVAPIPEVAARRKLPGRRNPLGVPDKTSNIEAIRQPIDRHLRALLGVEDSAPDIVQAAFENQLYFQQDHPALRGPRAVVAQRAARDWLLRQEFIAAAVTRDQLLMGSGGTWLDQAFRRSFQPQRSGDVLYATLPYSLHGDLGTTHGSPWNYDAHVPLLIMGRDATRPNSALATGLHGEPVSPAAIAATVAQMLGVERPSASSEPSLFE